ncbi:MAG: DUF502 domain-containing protein [Bacteroidetes bacterium]|nr:DUF502 domain-containing protein [Bacteroidota bacterium]MCL6103463.1 DUF502 domain-containing protein [Bacteroidota bacterium]
MKRLGTYFLQGLLLIAPLAATIYIVFFLFKFTDGLLSTYLEEYFKLKIPGLGILIIFLLLIFLGIIGGTIIAKPITFVINRILEKTPLLRLIYTSVKDLFSAFVGKERKFHRPVVVLVDEQNDLWRMGFLTNDKIGELGLKDKVAVYFPLSYNISGILYLVPVNRIKPLNIPAADAMKFVISGGVSDMDIMMDKLL